VRCESGHVGRGKSAFRQSDVTRLLRAAKAAGVKVRVEIEPGKLIAVPVDDDSGNEEQNEWDEDIDGADQTEIR
jgi:hypothetical protein